MNFSPSIDHLGTEADLQCLQSEGWLLNAVVQYKVTERKSRFWVSLIYVDSQNPFYIRIRQIDHYPTLKKAEQFAQLMQRGASRDPRGTFKLNTNAFYICAN